jgi:hypothetical protein
MLSTNLLAMVALAASILLVLKDSGDGRGYRGARGRHARPHPLLSVTHDCAE